jgi:SAM-dependent methyltransferase
MAESIEDVQRMDTSREFAVGANVYATIVDINSPDYERFQRFQDERFARLQPTRPTPSPDHSPTYVEATHTLPSEIIPIIVRRRRPLHAVTTQPDGDAGSADDAGSGTGEDELIGIARLELPGATLIESMIALREGSAAAEAIATARAAEVGGFATLEGISRFEIIAVVDAVVGVLIQLARQRGLDWLWIFPRAAFMSLLRADIPGVLPPYHFILSPDVAGWRPTSAQLEAFRSMRLRGFLDMPLIYQIATETFADDLQARMDCYDARMQLGAEIGPALGRAMITAQRTLRQEMELLYPSAARGGASADAAPIAAPVTAPIAAPIAALRPVAQPAAQGNASQPGEPSFLPEGLSENLPLATYLRRVVTEGGAPAQAYKELSYSLLEIDHGQRILDVGSGAGVDLLALAKLAGPSSTVVGLEINPTLVREARTLAAQQPDETSDFGNILVFQGDAEHMTIPNGEFDRARTDRALQHFPNPQRALAEIWRVLKPGGILTLVEPDWGSMVVAPGSAVGEGDSTISRALDWCRRHLAHPLMGRNLLGMLRGMPAGAWQSCKVLVAPFTFTDWQTLDAVLLLSRAAAALQQEEPEHASEIEEWLHAVDTASARGVFFGFIPMYYAVAVKSAADKLPGAR